MEDTISRKMAIDAHYEYCNKHPDAGFPVWSLKILEDLPSAQPVDKDINVPINDCISRQAAIDALHGYFDGMLETDTWSPCDVYGLIEILPSAQPEHTNSWCIDCKEYDTENKCCPRYNRVIKQTLDEIYSHAETEAEARFHAEIVRCKDCMYWVAHDKRCVYLNHGFAPNMWCCHGRRTDEV